MCDFTTGWNPTTLWLVWRIKWLLCIRRKHFSLPFLPLVHLCQPTVKVPFHPLRFLLFFSWFYEKVISKLKTSWIHSSLYFSFFFFSTVIPNDSLPCSSAIKNPIVYLQCGFLCSPCRFIIKGGLSAEIFHPSSKSHSRGVVRVISF